MRRTFGRAVGNVVSPIIEYIDIDGVVRRIDVDDIVERIDIDALVARIDLNSILDRVDINRQLDRVDIAGLIARSNINQIVARSSSGVFSSVCDAIRSRTAYVDQAIQGFVRLECVRKQKWLPPRPGERQRSLFDLVCGRTELWRNREVRIRRRRVVWIPWPKKTAAFSEAIQGRYCGTLTRGIGRIVDELLLATTFAVIILLVSFIGEIITKDKGWDAEENVPTCIVAISYYLFSSFYYSMCWLLVGRSIGIGIFGLLVVTNRGHRIGFLQSVLRALMAPLDIIFLGWLLGLLRRDGREWSDFISCTSVVYAWDVKMANLRQQDAVDKSVLAFFPDEEDDEEDANIESSSPKLLDTVESAL